MARRLFFSVFFLLILNIPYCFGDKITVVGAGYVGLIMSGILAKHGHEVICIDIDKNKIGQLKQKKIPIYEPGLEEFLFSSPADQLIQFTNDLSTAKESSVFYICLGTPSDLQGNCDCSSIYSLIDQIISLTTGPQLICIKSTVSPGTMSRLWQYILNHKRDDIELVYNPEFMREGSALEDIFNTNPLVLGGSSPEALSKIESFYMPILENNKNIKVIKTNYETAELIKYGWNSFSALRVTYFNELSRLCRELSADVFTMIQGIALSECLLPTKQIKPGCGYGGSCLSKDTLGLARVFEKHGISSSLVHQTIASNQQHIDDLMNSIASQLESEMKGKVVSILGLSFKANTDDIRYSPAISFIERLSKQGIAIRAYDPYAIKNMKALFPQIFYFDSPYKAVENSDCVLVLSDSEEIKSLALNLLASRVRRKLLIDPRNVFDPKKARLYGFKVLNLGRM